MESSALNEVVELSAWSINIRSCTKKDAVKANMLLVNVILPIVKEWLNKQRADVWYINRQNLQIGFNKEMSEYCILEVQEGNIIRKVIKKI